MPLSNSVCGKADKKGGKNEFSNPPMKIHFHSRLLKFKMLLNPKINKVIAAIKMRKPPTSMALKPNKAFFISMKEDPHTSESIMR